MNIPLLGLPRLSSTKIVFFPDSGHSETYSTESVTSLKRIPTSLASLPALALPCRLMGFCGKTTTTTATQTRASSFKEILLSTDDLIAEFVDASQSGGEKSGFCGPILGVRLRSDGKDVAASMAVEEMRRAWLTSEAGVDADAASIRESLKLTTTARCAGKALRVADA